MGGYNSGFKGTRKLTTSEVLCLDINEINIRMSGTFKRRFKWRDGSKIGILKDGQDRIVLGYAVTGSGLSKEFYKYPVSINYTPYNYGGERAWFICPECGRRCRKLYERNNYFRCRICQRLNYRLQQEDKLDRQVESINMKIYKLQDKLHLNRSLSGMFKIKRPKGMHRIKFRRLMSELTSLSYKRNQTIDRILIQLGVL